MTKKLMSPAGLGFTLTMAFLLIFTSIVTGCATTPSRDWTRVEAGMEKSEVLEIMGSPQRRIRRKGQDRWTYIFYDNQIRQEKVVHFEEGRTVYAGDPQVPAVSAEQQDESNEVAGAALRKKFESEQEAVRAGHKDFDEELSDVEEVVPSFEPVR